MGSSEQCALGFSARACRDNRALRQSCSNEDSVALPVVHGVAVPCQMGAELGGAACRRSIGPGGGAAPVAERAALPVFAAHSFGTQSRSLRPRLTRNAADPSSFVDKKVWSISRAPLAARSAQRRSPLARRAPTPPTLTSTSPRPPSIYSTVTAPYPLQLATPPAKKASPRRRALEAATSRHHRCLLHAPSSRAHTFEYHRAYSFRAGGTAALRRSRQ